MRRFGIILVSSVLFLSLAAALDPTRIGDGDGPGPARDDALTALVPAYFYPSDQHLEDWARLAEAARSIPLEVILNPASGPGKKQDLNYVTVIARLRRSGARILAYVDSDYGRRPLDAVEADLRTYVRFYKVDGFFIDQMANTTEAIDYYRSIRRLIRQIDPRLSVVGNPGTATRPEYLETADTLVTFEGSARTFAAYDPDAVAPWTAGHSRRRFAAIIYEVATAPTGRDTMVRARRNGSGSVYVTDRTMPNPYLGLPRYWADLVAAIRARNACEATGGADALRGPSG
jgi:hypothetical protein